ncbi:MAG: sigma-70 family RNA polymerase sigma factor [Verrucomicrobiae bacterium]|nr:sigma-70 family RNA polymerase sigma factor [Verrucomicrobiae bacterium]
MAEVHQLIARYQSVLKQEKLALLNLAPARKKLLDILWRMQAPGRQRRISARLMSSLVAHLGKPGLSPEFYFDALEEARLNLDTWNALREVADRQMPVVQTAMWRRIHVEANTLRGEVLLEMVDLVRVVGHSFSGGCSQIRGDLEGVGLLGLIKAVDLFKVEFGQPFEHYARTWIHSNMVAFCHKNNVVSPSNAAMRLLKQYEKVRQELSGRLGREPDDEEIAEAMNVSRGDLDEIKGKEVAVVSMDAPLSLDENEQGDLHDVLPCDQQMPFENLERRQFLESLLQCLGRLNSSDSALLRMYLDLAGDGAIRGPAKTLDEAAKTMSHLAVKRLQQALSSPGRAW